MFNYKIVTVLRDNTVYYSVRKRMIQFVPFFWVECWDFLSLGDARAFIERLKKEDKTKKEFKSKVIGRY